MVGQTDAVPVLRVTEVSLPDLAYRINTAHEAFENGMRESLAHAVEAGELLLRAKESLPHGQWLPWLADNFRGSHDTASRYIALSKRLPELEPNFARVRNMTLRGALKLVNQAKNADGDPTPLDEPDFVQPVRDDSSPDLSHFGAGEKFGTVYADPPWQYGNQGTRAATDNHYPTMPLDDICDLPVADIVADNAHLHLWTTNAFLFDARRVMEAWGFTYKSVMVWVKPQMGIGNYWRVSHEFLLFGIRGRAPFLARDEMSWHEAPRGRHSAKPDVFRRKIERVSPGPFIELFSRQQVPGWASWGNQVSPSLYREAPVV